MQGHTTSFLRTWVGSIDRQVLLGVILPTVKRWDEKNIDIHQHLGRKRYSAETGNVVPDISHKNIEETTTFLFTTASCRL
jgi:hypothetical protein